MTGDQWLDPSTVQLQYTLVNENATQPLFLLGGPHTCFRRLRVLCGGAVVEVIDRCNRIHEMFHIGYISCFSMC